MEQNVYIACVHWESGEWIKVQHQQFAKHLSKPPKHYAYLNRFNPEQFEDLFEYYTCEEIQKHNFKLNLLADEIAKTANAHDILIFVDGDAYPIESLQPYIEDINSGTKLVAVQRLENFGDCQPHPCFCMTTVGFWTEINGNWNPGHTWINNQGEKVTDVGGNLLNKLDGYQWKKLNRSNKINLHPLWFGIYDSTVYHHGAGFRKSISRIDQKILEENKENNPGLTYNVLIKKNTEKKSFIGEIALSKPWQINSIFQKGNWTLLKNLKNTHAMNNTVKNSQLDAMTRRWGTSQVIKHENFGNANYLKVLRNIHNKLSFKTYLEIGVRFGDSFKEAKHNCVGVDPEFRLKHNIMEGKTSAQLFQTYSDSFFETNAQKCFAEDKIDIAFLDGLHTSDQLLMDFINTEKYCHKDSIIILHDALPRTLETIQRDKPGQINMWTGDVWKVVPFLKKYRPDLKFLFLDAPPSGLVLITNLNSNIQYKNTADEMKAEIIASPNDGSALSDYLGNIEVTNSSQFIKKITASRTLDFDSYQKRTLAFCAK